MALIRDAIRIDGWARAQHATHTAEVRPEWCPLCEQDATIYTGYTLARDGRKTWHFTDDRDVLPPDLRGFRELTMRARPPIVQFAIHEIERDGERVRWQVGDDYYETPEPEPPSPAAPVSRPRYRLTPEGIIPCLPDVTPAPRSLESATVAVANSPESCVTTAGVAANASTSSPDAPALSLPKRTPRAATVAPVARKRKRAGTYGQLLDRLEALGATFCAECYAYQWPDHPSHLTRGPVVAVAHCTLAEPVMVDGIDGQSELVTIQEREAA